MFLFAPIAGVHLTALLVIGLWPVMFLGAFALSSFGVVLAARMSRSESFQVVNQFVTFPLIFLSGVFFPLQGLPGWMDFLVKINPVSYAVDPLRRLVLEAQNLPDQVMGHLGDLGLGLQVGGHLMTVAQDVFVIVVFGLLLNMAAMWLVSIKD